MKKKLYVGCALTIVPPDKKEAFWAMIIEIKKQLSEYFEVLEFKGVADLLTANPLTPQQVYDYDIRECVMKADYMLAICDYPSLGLGYELATAVEKLKIPVIAMAQKDVIVARLIRGVDHKNFHFVYYNSVDEIIEKTLEILK